MDQKEMQFISEIFERQKTEFQQMVSFAFEKLEYKLTIIAKSQLALTDKIDTLIDGLQALVARLDNPVYRVKES